MNNILKLRFFRLLSEYSQQQAPVLDFTEAIEELAKHLADISMNEQDYSILLRYFFFWTKQAQIVPCTIWARGKLYHYYLLMKQ